MNTQQTVTDRNGRELEITAYQADRIGKLRSLPEQSVSVDQQLANGWLVVTLRIPDQGSELTVTSRNRALQASRWYMNPDGRLYRY